MQDARSYVSRALVRTGHCLQHRPKLGIGGAPLLNRTGGWNGGEVRLQAAQCGNPAHNGVQVLGAGGPPGLKCQQRGDCHRDQGDTGDQNEARQP